MHVYVFICFHMFTPHVPSNRILNMRYTLAHTSPKHAPIHKHAHSLNPRFFKPQLKEIAAAMLEHVAMNKNLEASTRRLALELLVEVAERCVCSYLRVCINIYNVHIHIYQQRKCICMYIIMYVCMYTNARMYVLKCSLLYVYIRTNAHVYVLKCSLHTCTYTHLNVWGMIQCVSTS